MPDKQKASIKPARTGIRPGPLGGKGASLRAPTVFEKAREKVKEKLRLTPPTLDKAQEAMEMVFGPGEQFDVKGPDGVVFRIGVPVFAGVGHQAFAFNSPAWRALLGLREIRKAAAKKLLTRKEKQIVKEWLDSVDTFLDELNSQSGNRIMKFMDPNRGKKPPRHFDMPDIMTVGSLRRAIREPKFRRQMDAIRNRFLTPKQVGRQKIAQNEARTPQGEELVDMDFIPASARVKGATPPDFAEKAKLAKQKAKINRQRSLVEEAMAGSPFEEKKATLREAGKAIKRVKKKEITPTEIPQKLETEKLRRKAQRKKKFGEKLKRLKK